MTLAVTKLFAMRFSKNILLFLFTVLFVCPATSRAEISVRNVSVSSSSKPCNGTFTVRANGTAGPFTIVVSSPIKGEPDVVFENVYTEVVLKDLCNGDYPVQVFPTRFPSCVTYLEAILEDKLPGKLGLRADKLAHFGLEVAPNPTSGEVTVSVGGVGDIASAAEEAGWLVSVTDVNGAVLEERKVVGEVLGGEYSFALDLGQYPSGIYFVAVSLPDGRKESRRVVVQGNRKK